MDEITRRKFEYLFTKHPYIKPCFKSKEVFSNVKCREEDKLCLVSPDRSLYLFYLSGWLMKNPKLDVSVYTTIELMDLYFNNELSSAKDDIVVITDTRLMMPNKQKMNAVAQVFEQNSRCIYQYFGDTQRYQTDPYAGLDPEAYQWSNISAKTISKSVPLEDELL